MKLKTSVIVVSLLGSMVAVAQDVHFSQIENVPLLNNPALSGANSLLQVNVGYRSQWKSVTSPFSTINASIDARLGEIKRNKNGFLVAGLNLYNDQSGTLKLKTNSALACFGYHLKLDPKSTLGAALNLGFGQRVLDASAGRWGSQFNGNTYDPNLSSGESFSSANKLFFDAGAGLVYSYSEGDNFNIDKEAKSLSIGLAGYHVNQPAISFIGENSDKLNSRLVFFAKGTYGKEHSRISYSPALSYNYQGGFQEFLVGSLVNYRFQEASEITGFNKGMYGSLGLFYRSKDAVIVRGLVEWSYFSTGFSYDINISSLNNVSKARGAAEIFLRYTFNGIY